MAKLRESCGRCSMSTVVDTLGDGEDGEGGGPDPFEGERIEVPEETLRRIMFPVTALGRVKRWLDESASRFVYGNH